MKYWQLLKKLNGFNEKQLNQDVHVGCLEDCIHKTTIELAGILQSASGEAQTVLLIGDVTDG